MRRDPIHNLPQDVRLLKLIRRANLDALWSREPSTVAGNLLTARKGLKVAAALGFKDSLFRPMGPFPTEDTFGIVAAIVMLQQPLKPGKYASTIQFGTVRKLGAASATSTKHKWRANRLWLWQRTLGSW
jgi:hypothetical protein